MRLTLGTARSDRAVWYTAEVLLRQMLRWALKTPTDIRSSFLYLICNCPTVQVLVFKRCIRFFRNCKQNEPDCRFVAQIANAVEEAGLTYADLGTNTLTFWPTYVDL